MTDNNSQPAKTRIQEMQETAAQFNKSQNTDPAFIKEVEDYFANPVISIPVSSESYEPSRSTLIEKAIQDVMKNRSVSREVAEQIVSNPW